MSAVTVVSDHDAFMAIKEGNRKRYIKTWESFKEHLGIEKNWEKEHPKEEEVMSFVKMLRMEKKMASTTLWSTYSMLNTVVKNKYGFNLKNYVRVTIQLKTFDTDVKHKARVFTKEQLDRFFADSSATTPYWLIRKTVAIVAFFGGLRRVEAEML